MSASSAPVGRAHPPVNTSTTTLRTLLEARRAEGRRFALAEAVATIVPLSLDLQERHARGERLYVHPSCITPGPDGLARLAPKLATLPQAPRDRACLAPELQATLAPGDAKSSVFSLGAILYEMVTGISVGPGMPRPREIDPTILVELETLLEKALIANPAHRPDDIGALASALYHASPSASVHPPEVDPRNLDRTGEFDVDIRLSLMSPGELGPTEHVPAAPAVPRIGVDPYGAPVSQPSAPRSGPNVSERLVALKAHLESDPRPRYVVNKDKMDHGPFSAVELLQQIATHSFTGDHLLRDELSGQTHPIKEWEQFAPFAQQSALKREIVAEEKAVRRVVAAEKKGAAAKSTIAIVVVGALVAGAAVWFKAVRGSRNDDVEVADDPNALDLSLDGGVHGGAHHGGRHGGGAGGGGGGGGFSGGMSYEAAIAGNNTQVTIGQAAAADLTDSQLAGPMRNASFLNSCGAPNSMHVTVRIAIKMGRAVGVSVYTNPPSPQVAACVDRAVRNLSWPANGKMDSFTTTY
jgi:eukaryotic-like serine/threonine-protein kinase